jgi:hypothetical protein
VAFVSECPVCGNTSITPVVRQTMLHTSDSPQNTNVIGYRCENGHLCMANSENPQPAFAEPEAQSDSSSPYTVEYADSRLIERAKRLMQKTQETVRRSVALLQQSLGLIQSSKRRS